MLLLLHYVLCCSPYSLSRYFDFSGFNEKLFADKWGGEDWEVMDRMFGKGIRIIHQRFPRFYHLFHNRAGMWNT